MSFDPIGWAAALPLIEAVRTSGTLYPIVNGAHILFFAAGFGMLVTVDFAMLGFGSEETREELIQRVAPLAGAALAVAMSLGAVLFLTNPTEIAAHPAFRLKLVLIMAAAINALLFHRARRRGTASRRHQRLAAGASILFWSGVLMAGRMIAF